RLFGPVDGQEEQEGMKGGLALLGLAAVLLGARKAAEHIGGPDPQPERAGPLPWPVPRSAVTRIGQSVMADRDPHTPGDQPHYGLDLYCASGTEVRAVIDGRIVRVIDGRDSSEEKKRNAGLWIDLR